MAVNIKKDFSKTRQQGQTDISSLVYGKIPPQALEMEEAVLGAIMLESSCLQMVLEIVPNEICFYSSAHQTIYKTIRELEQFGYPIDLLTVTEQLRKNNELEFVGGPFYLTKLTMNVVSSAHVEAHARIIIEQHIKREMIRMAGEVVGRGYDNETDAFDLMEYAEVQLSDIANVNLVQNYKSSTDLVREQMERLQASDNRTSEIAGINTGYRYLNFYTSGWQAPDLIVLAARPSVGKTAFMLNLVLNALEQGVGVGIFSLEMASWQLVNRLVSMMSGVPLRRILNSREMSQDERNKYSSALEKLQKFNIRIDDTAGINSMQLRSKARRMITKHGVKFILVDYLQLMEPNYKEKSSTRENVVSGISRDLKKLAKEMNVPVIALSQLNRAVENRAEKVPNLSDLRESGAIEQDADIVMFLYGPKPTEIDPDTGMFYDETNIERNLDIAKNRQGSCETVKLQFNLTTQRITDKDESLKHVYTGGNTEPPEGFQSARIPPESLGQSKLYFQDGAVPPDEEEAPF